MKTNKCLDLFLTMLRIGAFTFGGGYAMIALLENEFVSKKKWIDKDEFLDLIAIAESTPGPIAINASTYIGYKVYGFFGSFVATAAMCIPSFIVIYFISLFFNSFLELTLVAKAFRGIQAGVIYLIFSAGIKMLRQIQKTPFNIAVLSVTVICMLVFSIFSVDFSVVIYILVSGVLGIFIYALGLLRRREEKK